MIITLKNKTRFQAGRSGGAAGEAHKGSSDHGREHRGALGMLPTSRDILWPLISSMPSVHKVPKSNLIILKTLFCLWQRYEKKFDDGVWAGKEPTRATRKSVHHFRETLNKLN